MRRFDHRTVSLLLFIGSEIESGPTNLYLRRLGPSSAWTPLLGQRSPTRFVVDAGGALHGFGTWLGIRYEILPVLARSRPAWFWHVSLESTDAEPRTIDLTYVQDLALAPYGAIRMNEFYVSQYVDHTPLRHAERGVVVASRQNQAADGRNPWSLIGSLRNGVSYATDALQFYGLASRASAAPPGLAGELPNSRLQHEHSLVVVRDAPLVLEPGRTSAAGFFGRFVEHHPDATSESDRATIDELLLLPERQPRLAGVPASGRIEPETARSSSLFSRAPELVAKDLDRAELERTFAPPWRHEERSESGELLAFFHGRDRHVVLRSKELRVLRPHGHMLRTGLHLAPDESALTSTVWMGGVFHSMLTQGHVSINRLLSTAHSYLGLFRSHGLRVFAEIDDAWHLLATPSAFEMAPHACRWIYRHAQGTVEVSAEARHDPQALTLAIDTTKGAPGRFLISLHIALNGDDGNAGGPARWRLDRGEIAIEAEPAGDVGRRFPQGSFAIVPLRGTRLEATGGDELLFADGASRKQPFVCLITSAAPAVGLSIRGRLVGPTAQPDELRASAPAKLAPAFSLEARPGTPAAARSGARDAARRVAQLADFAPWLAHNAFVHYLSPRGLEQYSGGGWGTRDVCQGPVELLLALGRIEPVRDLLLRVMRNQNPDGDWPQWFMFFERERDIRPGDSHGDIVFWPLLVLAQYLIASGDAAVLDEKAPFFHSNDPGAGEPATVWEHAKRALALIQRRVIPGTALAAYGHGDWNDSLQPADSSLRERLCSAWTVTLNVQVLATLARALRSIGRRRDAAPLEARAEIIRGEFQRHLVVDGVLAGYAMFGDGTGPRYLLHPRDAATGVRYSALAMIHAMLEDLLTPAQIREHLNLIDAHLQAPDGVRLFDRPMTYHGGPQRLFQRAETATFFGREIGLMYMHAHLRFAQALAHLGEAERFFEALCKANPIGIRSLVPSAAVRQSNCYYSSSDAAFADRYQASDEYGRVARGAIALEGGWRVYSSGAGIALGLIVRHFLGLGREAGSLVIDPVIPPALDGLTVSVELLGRAFEVTYRIGDKGCGVRELSLNGVMLLFEQDPNPHRIGAARIPVEALMNHPARDGNRLTVRIA